MKHIEEVEIWNYVEGKLQGADLQKVEHQIKHNSTYKEQYEMITLLHDALVDETHELPSFRFSQNVIEKVETNLKADQQTQFWLKLTKRIITGAIIITILTVLAVLYRTEEFANVDLNTLTTILFYSMSILGGFWTMYIIDIRNLKLK